MLYFIINSVATGVSYYIFTTILLVPPIRLHCIIINTRVSHHSIIINKVEKKRKILVLYKNYVLKLKYIEIQGGTKLIFDIGCYNRLRNGRSTVNFKLQPVIKLLLCALECFKLNFTYFTIFDCAKISHAYVNRMIMHL